MAEWIITSSFLILVVLLLRATLGKRIRAGFRYALWLVVLVRLLVPVSFFSLSVTLPRFPAWTPLAAITEESIYVLPVGSAPLEDSGVQVTEDGALVDSNSFGYPRLTRDGERVVRYAEKISPLELLGLIWLVGAVVMGIVLLTANMWFSIRLRRVRRYLEGTSSPIPVYVADGLPSPCLAGLLNPAVYVTREVLESSARLRHVLAHELTHYNHRDHLWSVLRGVALAVHWWNPLVWAAVVCSRRDGELACDEGALLRLGDWERTAYGETLLSLVTAKSKPGDLLCFATTMTGGKRSLRERIQRIACQPKQLVSALVAVVVLLTFSSLAAFGQTKGEAGEQAGPAADDARLDDVRLDDAWKTAEITLDESGTPYIRYILSNGKEETRNGKPIPAPRAWADDDTAGRNEAAALEYAPDVRAKLVSETDGWLVATYNQGLTAADTYIYRTSDRGMTWNEVTMSGISRRIVDVGFLSPDRLIVALQLLDDGAPCFITKDGGETWEEIELPGSMVISISVYDETVTMLVGASEIDNTESYIMTSKDMGDNWTTEPLKQTIGGLDLDHDGAVDTFTIQETQESGVAIWKLEFTASGASAPAWEGEAAAPHVGWTSFYLYRRDGEDYLLQYTPYMGGGACDYRYKLFYLTSAGEEIVVQENFVEFDLIFDPAFAGKHQYDPRAINDFMTEINGLLEESVLLVNTDESLQGTFRKTFREAGCLYDDLWWLDDEDNPRDENLSLLENLQNYGSYAQDHPDDTWSPLADLLQDLTEEDILSFGGDKSELVGLLKESERGSRFYTWNSYEEACDGHGVWERPGALLDVPLAGDSVLHLFANAESGTVLIILENPDETVAAFYDAPELHQLIYGWSTAELPRELLEDRAN